MNISEADSARSTGDLQRARAYQVLLNSTDDPLEQLEILIRMGSCLLETDLDEAEERIGQARLKAEECNRSDLFCASGGP